jgi:hypothetical protein
MVEPIGGFLSDRPQGYHQALYESTCLRAALHIARSSWTIHRSCFCLP